MTTPGRVEIRKLNFVIDDRLKGVLPEDGEPSKAINMNVSIPISLAQNPGTITIDLIIKINDIQIFETQWCIWLREEDAAPKTLNKIIELDPVNSIILRVLGIMVMNVSSLFMNTRLGPFPMAAQHLLQIIKAGVNVNPSPEASGQTT